MGHISELEETGISENIANKEIYKNYKKLKGKHDSETFLKNLTKFYEFTYNAYVLGEYDEGGPQSREQAYGLWVDYIGSYGEAKRYFTAIDNFSAYS